MSMVTGAARVHVAGVSAEVLRVSHFYCVPPDLRGTPKNPQPPLPPKKPQPGAERSWKLITTSPPTTLALQPPPPSAIN